MKAEELRIGNIVYYDGLENRIDAQDILLMEEREEYLNAHSPIPITEEWLLRGGFERLDPITYRYKGLKFRFNTLGILRIKLGKVYYLDYVHQLQNLYYALTGEELTFKTQ